MWCLCINSHIIYNTFTKIIKSIIRTSSFHCRTGIPKIPLLVFAHVSVLIFKGYGGACPCVFMSPQHIWLLLQPLWPVWFCSIPAPIMPLWESRVMTECCWASAAAFPRTPGNMGGSCLCSRLQVASCWSVYPPPPKKWLVWGVFIKENKRVMLSECVTTNCWFASMFSWCWPSLRFPENTTLAVFDKISFICLT